MDNQQVYYGPAQITIPLEQAKLDAVGATIFINESDHTSAWNLTSKTSLCGTEAYSSDGSALKVVLMLNSNPKPDIMPLHPSSIGLHTAVATLGNYLTFQKNYDMNEAYSELYYRHCQTERRDLLVRK